MDRGPCGPLKCGGVVPRRVSVTRKVPCSRNVPNPSVCFADTSPGRGGFFSTTRQRLPFQGSWPRSGLRGSTSRLRGTSRDVPTAESSPHPTNCRKRSVLSVRSGSPRPFAAKHTFTAFFTKKAAQRNSNLSHHFERAAGPRSTIFFIYYLLSIIFYLFSFPLPQD